MAHIHAIKKFHGEIITIASIKEGLKLLLSNKIDAVGTGSLTADHFIKNSIKTHHRTHHKTQLIRRDLDVGLNNPYQKNQKEFLAFSVRKPIKKLINNFLINRQKLS
jgi:hypothetical protein